MMIPTRSEPALLRLARAFVVAAALLAGASERARAQQQPVLLRIQPHTGDTMYTRFEQTVVFFFIIIIHSV